MEHENSKRKNLWPRKNFLSLKLNQNGKERDSHTHKHFTMMNLSSPPNNQQQQSTFELWRFSSLSPTHIQSKTSKRSQKFISIYIWNKDIYLEIKKQPNIRKKFVNFVVVVVFQYLFVVLI